MKKFYTWFKVTGSPKNYFIITHVPVRNRRQAKNLLTYYYREEFTENNLQQEDIIIMSVGVLKYYFGLMLDKFIKK